MNKIENWKLKIENSKFKIQKIYIYIYIFWILNFKFWILNIYIYIYKIFKFFSLFYILHKYNRYEIFIWKIYYWLYFDFSYSVDDNDIIDNYLS